MHNIIITKQNKTQVLKSMLYLKLNSIFSFKADWFYECFHLTLLNWEILYLWFEDSNIYSLFRTWLGSNENNVGQS